MRETISTKQQLIKEGFSLFIPIYNMGTMAEKNISICWSWLSRIFENFELIVIDDNSNDGSCDFFMKDSGFINEKKDGIKYFHYKNGPSRRENLAASFDIAQNNLAGFIDGDLSCDLNDIINAMNLIRNKAADIVIGSRYIKGAIIKQRFFRRIISFIYNSALRFFFNSNICDHQCGLKIFNMKTIMPIIRRMGYDETYFRGWFWDAELLIRAQAEGVKIIEMPVHWSFSDKSTFNVKKEVFSIIKIVKLWLELRSKNKLNHKFRKLRLKTTSDEF